MPQATARSRTLYFQPFSGGHHDLYLKHVTALAQRDGEPLSIAVRPDSEWATWLDAQQPCSPHLVQLTSRETQACSAPSLVRRGLAQIAAAERAANMAGAEAVFYGWIDQALVAFAARRAARPSAGILFRVPEPGSTGWTIGRTLLYQAAFSNPHLRRVLVLDRHLADRFNDERWSRGKVAYLPDPVDDTPPRLQAEDQARIDAARAEGRRIYLIAGSLDSRKGIDQTLDALARLRVDEAARVALFLVGRLVDAKLANGWQRRIKYLCETVPALHIHLEPRFVDDAEFKGFVQASDVILLLYRHVYSGSSGVLVHAAKAARPVIGTALGSVGRDIAAFGLGVTVDADDPNSISGAISADLHSSWVVIPASFDRFLAGRQPDEFARQVLYACHIYCKEPPIPGDLALSLRTSSAVHRSPIGRKT